jgi:hypothetical protein
MVFCFQIPATLRIFRLADRAEKIHECRKMEDRCRGWALDFYLVVFRNGSSEAQEIAAFTRRRG